MPKITILIIDDHRMLREAWVALLNRDNRFHVIGETGDGVEAIAMAKNLRPDIVLADINMSPMDGFEVTRQLCSDEEHPKVIGLSMQSAIGAVRKLLALGASGYLSKNSSWEEIVKAISAVGQGKQYICEEIKNSISLQQLENPDQVSLINRLTKREVEIVQQVKKGLPSREIALVLGLGLKTVEVHRYNILRKLNSKNSASLINFFNVNGI
jgi:DNA-binding NarL/FixJ family response regulator